VSDLEARIQEKISWAEKLTGPEINTAVANASEITITTLRTAPRDAAELEKKIKKLNARIDRINDTLRREPLYDEREALEWLLNVIRSKSIFS
jgi:hypothetical protein